MIEINFLPWREKIFHYQQKRIRVLLLYSSLLPVLAWMGAHYFFMEKTASLNASMLKLNHRLEAFSSRKMNAANPIPIKNFSADSGKLILSLANTADHSVCFTEISREKNRVNFTGNARSILDLMDYIKHWSAADLFSQFKFLDFMKQTNNQFIHFRFYGFENDLQRKAADDDV